MGSSIYTVDGEAVIFIPKEIGVEKSRTINLLFARNRYCGL